jgi:hypothetical protein
MNTRGWQQSNPNTELLKDPISTALQKAGSRSF